MIKKGNSHAIKLDGILTLLQLFQLKEGVFFKE